HLCGPARYVHRPPIELITPFGMTPFPQHAVVNSKLFRQPLSVAFSEEVVGDFKPRSIFEEVVEAGVEVFGPARAIVRGVAAAGVVGRRALRQQAETGAAVIMVVSQGLDQSLAFDLVGAQSNSDGEQAVKSGPPLRFDQINLEAHSTFDSAVEIGHPERLVAHAALDVIPESLAGGGRKLRADC